MMEHPVDFKRMVLRLPHSASDYASVTFVAQFAELLGLDVVGMYIEDESLANLAALPCVRELQLLGGGWRPIDAAELARGSAQQAVDARRLFQEAAGRSRASASFNLAKGSMAEVIASQSNTDDIIVVIEPKNPAERVTHQFRQLMDVAFNAPVSLLIVPSRLARQSGPVVAIATSEHDPSIRTALAIATTTKERLIIAAPPQFKGELMLSTHVGNVPVDRLVLATPTDGAELASALAHIKERFMVLSRDGFDHLMPPQLASGRGVPVLVMEGEKSGDSLVSAVV
jgi:hypothetical protein